MEITTPSGYTVIFKDENDLTYRDMRRIRRSIMAGMNIGGADNKVVKMDGGAISDAQDEILRLIIKRIVIDGKSYEENLFDMVMDWKDARDGDAVYEVVDKQFQAINQPKN